MKIGLDVAWRASKGIVDRIVLVTGDSDFVPALKFARREGVQVVLVTMGETKVKHDLLVHADQLRTVAFP
ncbi:MAG: NYN domain-containing protein [Longimicrobiaceae bacterium]